MFVHILILVKKKGCLPQNIGLMQSYHNISPQWCLSVFRYFHASFTFLNLPSSTEGMYSYSSTHSLGSKKEMGGQRHALAAVPRRKRLTLCELWGQCGRVPGTLRLPGLETRTVRLIVCRCSDIIQCTYLGRFAKLIVGNLLKKFALDVVHPVAVCIQ
jgi:hypothetical protein